MKKRNIVVISLLLIFILITVLMLTGNISIFDDIIYNALFSIRNNFFDTFFKTITKLGNTITIIILVIILILTLKKEDKYLIGINVVTTVLTNQILKHIIRRERPPHLRLIKEGGFSYPSGHAMISIALYGMLIYIVNKNIKNKYLKITLTIILSLIILGIGLSRIYVGVHYPSDILSGYILSLVIIILVVNYTNDYFRGK